MIDKYQAREAAGWLGGAAAVGGWRCWVKMMTSCTCEAFNHKSTQPYGRRQDRFHHRFRYLLLTTSPPPVPPFTAMNVKYQ